VCSVTERTGVRSDGLNSLVIAFSWGPWYCVVASRSFCESASSEAPGSSLRGTVKRSPLIINPSPTRKVISPGVTNGIKSGLSAAMIIAIIESPKPTVAVITPPLTLRRRFSAGDSKNFSSCGNTSSATCSSSFPVSNSLILSAKAWLICSRAELQTR